YVFSANKGGHIDVFDVSDPDDFTLVGMYDTTAPGDDAMTAPHDCTNWGTTHIVFVNHSADGLGGEPAVAMIEVFDSNGDFIPIASWEPTFKRLSTGNGNRVKTL